VGLIPPPNPVWWSTIRQGRSTRSDWLIAYSFLLVVKYTPWLF